MSGTAQYCSVFLNWILQFLGLFLSWLGVIFAGFDSRCLEGGSKTGKLVVILHRVNVALGFLIMGTLIEWDTDVSLWSIDKETVVSKLLNLKFFGKLIVEFNIVLLDELNQLSVESSWHDLDGGNRSDEGKCGETFHLLLNYYIKFLFLLSF